MAGHSYEESIKLVYKGLVLLAIVTLVEVFFSLLGKGHIVPGLEDMSWVAYVIGFIIIVLSIYKAYFIIYEFMHMRYEAKGLAMTVLLPTLLLVWAIIAFFQEGSEWNNSREKVKTRNEKQADTYFLEGEKRRDVKIIHHHDAVPGHDADGHGHHQHDGHGHNGGDGHNHNDGQKHENHGDVQGQDGHDHEHHGDKNEHH